MPPAQPRHAPYVHPAALQVGAGSLWVCEGTCDVLALRAAGVARVVAIFGVQGWRWDWVREVRELVFALDADATGQQQWRALAREAALRGKGVAVLEPAAYGGYKDVNEAWAAGVLVVRSGPTAGAVGGVALAVPPHRREPWTERVAMMVVDGGLACEEAERLAWQWLQAPEAAPETHAAAPPPWEHPQPHRPWRPCAPARAACSEAERDAARCSRCWTGSPGWARVGPAGAPWGCNQWC